jgi:hypothetical protein
VIIAAAFRLRSEVAPLDRGLPGAPIGRLALAGGG